MDSRADSSLDSHMLDMDDSMLDLLESKELDSADDQAFDDSCEDEMLDADRLDDDALPPADDNCEDDDESRLLYRLLWLD